MKKSLKIITLAMVSLVLLPNLTYAATSKKLSVSGWIPYWEKTAGTAQALSYEPMFASISPFSYEVDKSGMLIDKMKINDEPWTSSLDYLIKKKTAIYPTVAWFDGDQIDDVLKDKTKRAAHIASITDNILENPRFAGVDIDYENKKAENINDFSAFIKELSIPVKKNKKKLICTIEPRTPLEARYNTVTPEIKANIAYANDYAVLGKYCDEVRIMAYDQAGVDLTLKNKYDTGSEPYMPSADPLWVEKVIKLAIKDIPANKIMLGVNTYGYKYEIVPKQTGGYTYTKLRSMSYQDSINLAVSMNQSLKRSPSGEVYYTYNAVWVNSLAGATSTPVHTVFFPDEESILNKINLAKKYKLKGIALFKIDGDVKDNVLYTIMKNR